MTENNNPTRIFKIGSVRITEDASMVGKTTTEIQKMLSPLYPQIEHATVREQTDEATGMTEVSFLNPPGRKG